MTDRLDGRSFRVPRCRRLSWDLLYFNKAIPQCAHDRWFDLSDLIKVRGEASVRISWAALFMKAYGLLAQEIPELRQTWYRWPFAHIYQHPHSVGVLTVQRTHKSAPWLFWGRLAEPENTSLLEIQKQIDVFQNERPSRIFGREVKLASLPTVLRRLIWGWNIHVAKSGRASRLGTFFMSTLAGRGAEIQLPPAIHTGCLTYGPIGSDGRLKVTLAYDHRVMDGALVATCLSRLESILLKTLGGELLQPAPVATKIPSAVQSPF